MADVVGVGGIYIDIISYVPRALQFGESLRISKYGTSSGGKGANQIVAAARLGASTAMVGKVGDDLFGKICLQGLKESGVNTDYVTTGGQTGFCSLMVNEQGQYACYFVNGANELVTPDDVMATGPLIEKSKVMICNMELGQPIIMAAMKLAQQHGVTTILTPDATENEDPIHPDLMRNADIVCPNEYEAHLLTGQPSSTVEEAKKVIPTLLQHGPRQAIITLGEKGSVVASLDNPQSIHIPAKSVKVADTIGAGDALAGSLAYYIANFPHLPFEEKVKRAMHIATVSVQKEGTQDSFPWRSELPDELFTS